MSVVVRCPAYPYHGTVPDAPHSKLRLKYLGREIGKHRPGQAVVKSLHPIIRSREPESVTDWGIRVTASKRLQKPFPYSLRIFKLGCL